MKITKRYLKTLIKSVISEEISSDKQQEIDAAVDSDEDLKNIITNFEERLAAFEQELEAMKKERDNALTQMRGITGGMGQQ